ncbi:MAG: SMP-30/gluconolactonase/LRE family protein [Candidatus Heimdallarchaeota archaeon]
MNFRLKNLLVFSAISFSLLMSNFSIINFAGNKKIENTCYQRIDNKAISIAENFTVSTLIAPTGLNSPIDITVDDEGRILVANTRLSEIAEVFLNGTIKTYTNETSGNALDFNPVTNKLYTYMINGEFYSINATKHVELFYEFPNKPFSCDFASHPITGDIYFGYGRDYNKYDLYKITPEGTATLLRENMDVINAITFRSNGEMYMCINNVIYEYDIATDTLTHFADGPEERASFHSMIVDDNGEIYIGTGGWDTEGRIHKYNSLGTRQNFAFISENGVEGITFDESDNIIGVQRLAGGIIQVDSLGVVTEIVEGNHLNSPNSMVWSPQGELFVANDDGGKITRYFNNKNSFYAEAMTFTTPNPYLAIDYWNRVLMTETAPGFPERLVWINDSVAHTISDELPAPCGVCFDKDGNIWVSAMRSGELFIVAPNGTLSPKDWGLIYPGAIAWSADDYLYMISGSSSSSPIRAPEFPGRGYTLIKWSANEAKQIINCGLESMSDLAIDTSGRLFVVGTSVKGRGVYQVLTNGTAIDIVTGYEMADGIAIDVEGNIYFSENQQAAIYKITTPFARGEISGQVTHPSTGLPVENVKIKFWHNSLDYVGGTITTNSTGHYNFECSPGEYDLEILSGYSGGCYKYNIVVEEEQTTIVDVNSNDPSTITMPTYPIEEEEPEGWFKLSPQVIQGLIILGSASIGIFICCFLTVRITKRRKRKKGKISGEVVDAQFTKNT